MVHINVGVFVVFSSVVIMLVNGLPIKDDEIDELIYRLQELRNQNHYEELSPANNRHRQQQRLLQQPPTDTANDLDAIIHERLVHNLHLLRSLANTNADEANGSGPIAIKRNLDSIGGAYLLKRNLDSIGGANLLKRSLDSIGGANLLKRK